jgi:hypothetical protein
MTHQPDIPEKRGRLERLLERIIDVLALMGRYQDESAYLSGYFGGDYAERPPPGPPNRDEVASRQLSALPGSAGKRGRRS